jgi:protein involved in polysaccharide export with SLBB domain
MVMRTTWATGALLSAVMLSGCFFEAQEKDLEAFLKPTEADVTGEDYIIEPPDRITVIASDIPELRGVSSQLGQTQEIRPDGMISYEKIGEIPVAGKTPRQVAELIALRLSELYKLTGDYPIDVRVTNQSKLYYVLGQVRMPGAKVFTGRETTLSALAKAVPTDYAWKEQIQVIRPSRVAGERSRIFALDYRDMVIRGRTDQIVLLEEGDIIYVPPTVFAAIGITVGEIVGPILQGGRTVQMMGG